MKIGLDLDNTIINYDTLFLKALHRFVGEIDDVAYDKESIKRYLREKFGDEEGRKVWFDIQAWCYGKGIEEAELSEDFVEFLRWLLDSGDVVKIISHKSEFPFNGEKTNLRDCAVKFLTTRIPEELLEDVEIIFCNTAKEKINAIREEKLDCFFDSDERSFDGSLGKTELFLISEFISSTDKMEFFNWHQVKCWLKFVKDKEIQVIKNVSKMYENKVKFVETSAGKKYIVKNFSKKAISLGRGLREFRHLDICRKHNIHFVPEVISISDDESFAVLEYIPGEPFQESYAEYFPKVINRLLEISRINDNDLFLAADSSESLEEYSTKCKKRLESLKEAGYLDKNFLKRLDEAFLNLDKEFDKKVSRMGLVKNEIFGRKILRFCFSDPSIDNFIFDNGKISLIDFEISGLDDPARMLCNVISHLRDWLTSTDLDFICREFRKEFKLDVNFSNRVKAVLDMVGFERILINLNIFSLDRNYFSGAISLEELKSGRIEIAKKRLEEIEKNFTEDKEFKTLDLELNF